MRGIHSGGYNNSGFSGSSGPAISLLQYEWYKISATDMSWNHANAPQEVQYSPNGNVEFFTGRQFNQQNNHTTFFIPSGNNFTALSPILVNMSILVPSPTSTPDTHVFQLSAWCGRDPDSLNINWNLQNSINLTYVVDVLNAYQSPEEGWQNITPSNRTIGGATDMKTTWFRLKRTDNESGYPIVFSMAIGMPYLLKTS